MFVLFSIDQRTGKPERVTQHESRSALRRMWMTYPSAAIGDLDGGPSDVEVKPTTDRVRAVALSRAIAQAQRAHRRGGDVEDSDDAAEPEGDRDAKPENVMEPEPPVVAPSPQEEPAPPAVVPAPPVEPPGPLAPVAVPEKLPPLHRHACDRVPCPVVDCEATSAPYNAALPVELRALCKRHRDNVQANRSKGMRVGDALETVLANGRARLARANAAAAKRGADPRMEGEPAGPRAPEVFLTHDEITARLRALTSAAPQPEAARTAPDALTRADLAAVLRDLRGGLDAAIARLESPR